MKVLLLAKVPAHFEQFKSKGEDFPKSQAQYLWKKALVDLGHDVEVFLYSDPALLSASIKARIDRFLVEYFPNLYHKLQMFKNKFYKFIPQNHIRTQKLIKKIIKFKPEKIIIAGGVSELLGKFFSIAKKYGIKVIMLHGEDPKVSATSFEMDHIADFDHIIVNDELHQKNWLKMSAKSSLALPYSGIDSSYHWDKKKARDIDVVFVGSLLADRQKTLEKVASDKLQIYGYIHPHIGLSDKLKAYYKGEAWGQKMVDIFNQSKIAINFLPPHMPHGGNIRQFEIPGCGAMQLSNRCPQDWFTHGKEVVVFLSDRQLAEKISYYLDHDKERSKIARAGHKKTHQNYTYQQRFSKILSLI